MLEALAKLKLGPHELGHMMICLDFFDRYSDQLMLTQHCDILHRITKWSSL